MLQWGPRFGFPKDSGKIEGNILTFERVGARLEVFLASGAVWFRSMGATEGGLMPYDRAREVAEEILHERSLWNSAAQFNSVVYTLESEVDCSMQKLGPARRIEQHVGFGFELEGLPVLGAGGRMRVSFKGQGKEGLVSVFRFYREAVADGDIGLISADQAEQFLRQDEDLARFGDRVHLSEPVLGYLSFPPRISQAHLLPVYGFEGRVDVPGRSPDQFLKYVQAVDAEPLDGLPRIL